MNTGKSIGIVAMAMVLVTSFAVADVYFQTGFETSEGYPVGGTDVTVVGNDGWTASAVNTNWYYQLNTAAPISGLQSATLSTPRVRYSNPTYYRTFTTVTPDVVYFSMDINLNNVVFQNDAGTYRGVHFYLLNGGGVTANQATAEVDITYTATYGNGIFARDGASQLFIQAAPSATTFTLTMELFLTGANADKWNLYIDGVKGNSSLMTVRNSSGGQAGGILVIGEGMSMPDTTSKIFLDNIYVANVIPEPVTAIAFASAGCMMLLRRKK